MSIELIAAAAAVRSSGLSISALPLLRATEIARNWNNATRDCISSAERGREREAEGGGRERLRDEERERES